MYQKLQVFRQNILNEKSAYDRNNKHFGKYREMEMQMYDQLISPEIVVSLDVGGTHKIRTSQDVLCKVNGSLLQRMFLNVHDMRKNQDGFIFLDRDGKTFLNIVNWLRNDRRNFPAFETKLEQDLFLQELNYWKLNEDMKPGVKALSRRKSTSPFVKKFK